MVKKLLLLILTFFLCFINVSCSFEKNKPEQAFQKYLDAWKSNDFAAMYQYVSSESKTAIEENTFVQRYKSIYSGIEAANVEIQGDYSQKIEPDKTGVAVIPFTCSMRTMAGDIRFSSQARMQQEKVEDKKEWRIIWTPEMIFPELGDGDKVRVNRLAARRGEIVDKKNRHLAMNGTAAEIGIVPGKLNEDPEGSKKKIAEILGTSVENINKKLSASYVKPDMFIPMKVVSEDELDIKEQLLQVPGIMINSKKTRVYPLKEKAAHLVGYVQTISVEELEKFKDDGYSKEDLIGKSGLEKIYEKQLRAKSGVEIIIVDKDGKKKSTLARLEPEDGHDLQLTIDADMQNYIYDQLGADSGTAVAINPKTGEVLALVNTPAYNPNNFVLGMSDSEWKALNGNPKKPLSNRFQSNFCPGSVFKPVTAAIALSGNKIDKDVSRNITGLKWQKDKSWGNYSITRVSEYSGPSNLLNAMIHSDNIYFAQTALDIGEVDFASMVKNFGIGDRIPFEYEMAKSQFDKDGIVKSEVQLADSGYGQGEVLLNPLHLASIYSAFSNEGNMIKPYLECKAERVPEAWKSNVFSADIAKMMTQYLLQAVENPEGTGHQAFIQGLPLAGKTGTAEIKLKQGDANGTELGWFVAYNVNNPKLLVVAMVEDVKNRGGSHYVVPKVKAVFEKFVKN
ncbi:MAG: penicillin-binding transpeptidase domain-containing protein [Clostridia bacterium]|nr:penicillin-binding transpeptidase domain-containing protein [Clostridia bacterium]